MVPAAFAEHLGVPSLPLMDPCLFYILFAWFPASFTEYLDGLLPLYSVLNGSLHQWIFASFLSIWMISCLFCWVFRGFFYLVFGWLSLLWILMVFCLFCLIFGWFPALSHCIWMVYCSLRQFHEKFACFVFLRELNANMFLYLNTFRKTSFFGILFDGFREIRL